MIIIMFNRHLTDLYKIKNQEGVQRKLLRLEEVVKAKKKEKIQGRG